MTRWTYNKLNIVASNRLAAINTAGNKGFSFTELLSPFLPTRNAPDQIHPLDSCEIGEDGQYP